MYVHARTRVEFFKTKFFSLITGIQVRANRAKSESVSAVDRANRGMVLPFAPLSLCFSHVNYYVDIPPVSSLSNGD